MNQVFESDTFPILKTPRLTLREILIDDARAIFKMRSSRAVNRFIARDAMTDVESAEELVQRTNKAFSEKQGIGWAGILRDGNEIVGTCGLMRIDHMNNRAELGGELNSDFWGKHIAIEAVSAIVEFGFKEMQLHSIEARVNPKNRGAIFLMEKLGFEKEGHLKEFIHFKDAYLDLAIYTLFERNFKGF